MATETSKPEPPLREGDLLFYEGEVVEVSEVDPNQAGRKWRVTCYDGKVFWMTANEARDALISRDEDLYSTTILDLRFKEAMLMSQLELMATLVNPNHMQEGLDKALLELHRTLYAVRFMLEKRGARRADDE